MQSMAISIEILQQTQPCVVQQLNDIGSFMEPVFSQAYPGFMDWYMSKAMPGFLNSERSILVARHNKRVVGISILKIGGRRLHGGKICSFYIAPEARGWGLGHELMWASLGVLGTQHNVARITTPSQRALLCNGPTLFDSFLHKHGFSLVDTSHDKYRFGWDENLWVASRSRWRPRAIPSRCHSKQAPS